MKKQLIATMVGGILLFLWQFLSWTLLNVHGAEFTYSPNQDKIMEVLTQNLEEGQYMMPMPAPNSTPEQQQAFMEVNAGKPWATLAYHKSMSTNMGMNMFRAFLVDLLAVFLLVWLLGQRATLQMGSAVLSSLAVGGIGYLTIPYLNTIWFETSSIGYLIDTFVQWGLVGVWLGWWLTKK